MSDSRSATLGTCAFAMKQSSPVTRSQEVISGIAANISATRFNSPAWDGCAGWRRVADRLRLGSPVSCSPR